MVDARALQLGFDDTKLCFVLRRQGHGTSPLGKVERGAMPRGVDELCR